MPKGGAKKRKIVGLMRAIFADNLRRALESRYPTARNKPLELQKQSGVSKSTIQRWLNGEASPNLDQIEAVAIALKLQPHELLVPLHGLSTSRDPPFDSRKRDGASGAPHLN